MNIFKRGALIVVEGVDRSGKSTQAKLLAEALRFKGYKTELMVFPDRTTNTGRLINEYLSNKDCKLNDEAIHLLFAANRWESVDKIKMLLNEGITIIVDRYSYSGMVYSMAKSIAINIFVQQYLRICLYFILDMNIGWCSAPENGLPKPDTVFLLTLSNEAMQKRPSFGEERYENTLMQKRVADNYMKLIDDNWSIIDADGEIEVIHKILLNSTINVIKNVGDSKLKYLNFN